MCKIKIILWCLIVRYYEELTNLDASLRETNRFVKLNKSKKQYYELFTNSSTLVTSFLEASCLISSSSLTFDLKD